MFYTGQFSLLHANSVAIFSSKQKYFIVSNLDRVFNHIIGERIDTIAKIEDLRK